MSFPQLTCRESLRDIEACLGAVPDTLHHLGTRAPVTCSALADAAKCRSPNYLQKRPPSAKPPLLGISCSSSTYNQTPLKGDHV